MAEAAAPVRVIVHAGFHKTGTSSLQSYLENNRAALRPYLAYYGKPDMPAVDATARAYGLRPFPWRLAAFRTALRRFLAEVPEDPVIVLSRERFCGPLPGLRGWHGRKPGTYAPISVPMARALAAELGARFGGGTRVEFLYTLRDREAWLRSLYGHLLRVTPLKEDFERFRRHFPASFTLETEAARISRALAPLPVHTARLERHAKAHCGPAQAIFDLVALPGAAAADLPPARRWNRGQPVQVESQFLRLNRSGGPSRRQREIKEALGTRTHPRHAKTKGSGSKPGR